jgi:NAD+ synthase (glutamine-hydrolysing)
MCRLVAKAAAEGSTSTFSRFLDWTLTFVYADQHVIADARRMTLEPEDSSYLPTDPREFCGRIFHSCYMGTENSSADTRGRAKALADAIGSYHVDMNMDKAVTAVREIFGFVTGIKPRFKAHGGTEAENLALQNIQVSNIGTQVW